MTAEQINAASYSGGALPDGQSAIAARIQILLDRRHVSPGVIDGRTGNNLRGAIADFESIAGLPADGVMDEDVWSALSGDSDPALVPYRITGDDLAAIVPPLSEDYGELSRRDRLGFTSIEELLGERFHMDVDFLTRINPGADFTSAGTEIWVVNPADDARKEVERIVVERSTSRARAYDGAGKIVAAYPVTVGSRNTPSPHGTHKVVTVVVDPNYTYRPSENFVQGDNTEPLILPPGPNNPVGTVWIDLSEPTYGIHGTPEPAEIDKSVSHGCVRMTNWDAMELAHLVGPGVAVELVE